MNTRFTSSKVTAVIVTYRSGNTLSDLIPILRAAKQDGAMETVFVDNNSPDNTAEILAQQQDWCSVILSKENNGFGRGCNLGLAKVTTPYTLFLNPDAYIEPTQLQVMVDFMEANPHVGITGPATYCGPKEGPQTLQGTSRLPTPVTIIRAAVPLLSAFKGNRPIVPGTEPFSTGWVCGAVYLIRTAVALKLGGFDPRFFLYWEEMDLCARAANAGYQTWALPTAQATHLGGASSDDDETRVWGCIGEHYYKSRRYYLIKHHGWLRATVTELIEYVLLVVRTLSDWLRGKGWSRIRPRLQAPIFSQPDPYP